MKPNIIDVIIENLMEATRNLKVIYKDNNSQNVPLYMAGTSHQIRTWLFHRKYDGFIKDVFKKE